MYTVELQGIIKGGKERELALTVDNVIKGLRGFPVRFDSKVIVEELIAKVTLSAHGEKTVHDLIRTNEFTVLCASFQLLSETYSIKISPPVDTFKNISSVAQ